MKLLPKLFPLLAALAFQSSWAATTHPQPAGAGKPAAKPASPSAQIDALLAKAWEKNQVSGNPIVADDVFVRRAYLTVAGRIPTFAEASDFLNSKAPDKRARLIDDLLNSEGYVMHFFNYWADVLRAKSQGVASSVAAQNYVDFIRQSLRDNKPFDQLTRELLSAEGATYDNGAIGYYMRDRGMPLDNLSNTVRVFLGTRLECAQCHDHPFDKWSQRDFYQMAAFTHNMSSTGYQSESGNGVSKLIREDKDVDSETRDMMRRAMTEITTPLRDSRVVQNKSALKFPHDYKYPDAKPNEVVEAAVMFGKPLTLAKDSNPAQEFAYWLASPDNPRFTTVIANRLWKRVFGLGLIEPVDEMMDSSAAANPELMKFLESQMVTMKYDMKAYLRMLLNTQAFQRASSSGDIAAGTVYQFQGPAFRRMTSEQIWDSMVALVNPEPDQANWTLRERERQESDNRKRLTSLLDKTDAPLLLEATKLAANAMKEQNRGFDQLRKELDEARAKDDKEKARDIQRRLNDSQRVFRQTVSRCFYDAAKKADSQDIKAELAEACDSMGGSMEMAVMNMMETPRVDPKDMPLDAGAMKSMDAEMTALGIADPKARRSYLNYRKTLHQNWCRAAELPSPAPRGHFLREFGQSDRDVIENANEDASVPQALALLNGSVVSQLASGWSALSANLRRAGGADQKIDTLFTSLFSRKATASEHRAVLQMIERAKDKNTVWEDIVLAVVSTDQFLFIQ